MTRFKLTVEYDGGPFVGWQRQDNGPSVQSKIESAIKGFCGVECAVFGAGRTDAGVHALGQVAHVDIPDGHSADTVRDALNFHLRPCPISILNVDEVDDEFHARFSATRRHYLYRIIVRRSPLALEQGRAWHNKRELDTDAMHDAAQVLVGQHDFTTFRSAACQSKSPVKTVDAVAVSRALDEIQITCRARSFLHNQVRSFVGSLKLVGEGKWSKADLQNALAAADRKRCGPVAPAHGLYLTRVGYD